ncbi:hypothetical protein CCMSSC00406_0007511 [Pleurotus cornucopiae]|uniref:Uncharacterized protein n=1 Tax=Pleurotus cornucopiae TaxID=5321 RepID=A0ACB7J773_PLECO|nr:hypothetical protein CCMSSC00406_0007511 [Pleurotus cornucopiae]
MYSRPRTSSSLAPPRSIAESTESDNDSKPSLHSRTQSHPSAAASSADSPPVTPRSPYNAPVNPFSPPPSVRSFSSPDHTPVTSPGMPGAHAQIHYPFPDSTPRSGTSSVSASSSDLPRASYSRPTTGDYPGSRPSSARLREAFASPPARPLTIYGSAPAMPKIKLKERPKSTMLTEGVPAAKPWLTKKDPYAKIAYVVTYGMILVGIAAGAVRVYFDYHSVRLMPGNLCPVLDEDFSNGDDGLFGENGKFFREVDMSGFGNGEFAMATASSKNSFVRDGKLWILPTLTSEEIGNDAVFDNHIYNITGCTFNTTRGWSYTASTPLDPKTTYSTNSSAIGDDVPFDEAGYVKACSAVSNSTTGTIINPIQSARLSTRNSASIRFGKVEVRAKIPTGDWMWPAIWMLPVDSAYGPWPLSGEIDIMEARGNGPSYPAQGTNFVRSSLNWGPFSWLNGVWKTYGWARNRYRSYDMDYHTYTLEWTEDFIRMSVDSRLRHMLEIAINTPFFDRGDFPPVVQNGSSTIVLQNPWINGTKAAPFDQRFYLILNVAVGGTNGWFPDNNGHKPWLDGSQTAMREFAQNQNQWLPSWPTNEEERAFVIDSVKMWQQC